METHLLLAATNPYNSGFVIFLLLAIGLPLLIWWFSNRGRDTAEKRAIARHLRETPAVFWSLVVMVVAMICGLIYFGYCFANMRPQTREKDAPLTLVTLVLVLPWMIATIFYFLARRVLERRK